MGTPSIDEATKKAVGRRVKAVREAMGWTGPQLAALVGATPGAVYNWESGARLINVDAAIILHRETKVPFDYLFLGDESGLPLHLAMKILPPDRFFARGRSKE